MNDLRYNIVTGDWVIIAPDRSRRPTEYITPEEANGPVPAHLSSCPFCPENESDTLPEEYSVSGPDGWLIRVVPNKFPALARTGERKRHMGSLHRHVSAVGIHDVVIEHRRHDLTIATMSPGEVAGVLWVYRERFRQIREDTRIEAIVVFRNHQESAGSSLHHPHSQILATPIVPAQFRQRIETAIRHYDTFGECVFCSMVRNEVEEGSRVVAATEHFVAFIPYAAVTPFHTWIVPRRHASSFDTVTDVEINDLGGVLRSLLLRLRTGLGDPPYNYIIRTIPIRTLNTEYFHWYLTIVPRLTRTAGFELGSGMFINGSLPEENAEFLRTVQVDG
ncbi:MAG: galactose-1-phosphate uridylyltransferase [Proteobacteria bacterium]|nr:galactose-1-phosphate uridylyltransferase [Pseudomonadota bacterium]